MDREILAPVLFGVSKAISENAILVHQARKIQESIDWNGPVLTKVDWGSGQDSQLTSNEHAGRDVKQMSKLKELSRFKLSDVRK